ncbi:AraC family transcriptional regulator [Segnochrobactraceae bacterium EtOH-i3]
MSRPSTFASELPAGAFFRAGLGRALPPGYIRIGVAITTPEVLRSLNVDPVPLCREAGVPMSLFSDPDNCLPMRTLGRLVTLAVAATGRTDLGLLIAESVTASTLGLTGFLLKQAPDVRTALQDLVRYMHYNDRCAVPLLEVKEGLATFSYLVIEPGVSATDQINDGAMLILRNILRALCGPRWVPLGVTLSRPRPPAPARYERAFGAPVVFDAEASTMTFAESWLDVPLPHADPALRRMLQEQIDLMEEEAAGDFPEKVRRLMRACLITRACSIDEISALLQINRRTLSRRLEETGTSFRTISSEIHYEIARQLIENTALSMTQIALVLRFSEASAFTRAFRHWSGMSPRAWRQRHRARARTARLSGEALAEVAE